MYKHLLRPILFRFNAETAHNLTFSCLKFLRYIPFADSLIRLIFRKDSPELSKEVFGLKFKNPVGLANCVRYVAGLKSEFDICFALNDNDADGRDVSWIWDASFVPLSRKSCDVYSMGTRCYDMALRLKYDSIDSAVIEGEDYRRLIDTVRDNNRDFVVLATYTAMMNMRKVFVREFGGDAFWHER